LGFNSELENLNLCSIFTEHSFKVYEKK
jgi:hypothetical protein